MPFRVITKDDAQELVRDVKSITGAKRTVVEQLVERANAILADDALWAPRSTKLMREEVQELARAIKTVNEYGVNEVTVAGVTYRIEQDADAPTRREERAGRKVARESRWMGAKFEADCGTCKRRIAQGEQQFYVYTERKPYCANGCGQAREVAAKTAAMLPA